MQQTNTSTRIAPKPTKIGCGAIVFDSEPKYAHDKINIYADFAESCIKDDKKSRLMLTYLKVQQRAVFRGGRYSIKDVTTVCDMSRRTAQKQINEMQQLGWVVGLDNGTFRLVSQKDLCSKGISRYVQWSFEFINSFSHRKISYFRANISEIVIENKKASHRGIIKGYTKTTVCHRTKTKVRTKVQDEGLKGFHNLAAVTYRSLVLSKRLGTVTKYKERQCFSRYTSVRKKVKEQDIISCGIYATNFLAEYNGKLGKFFFLRGEMIFSPISERECVFSLKTKKFKQKKSNFLAA